jgi:hypothetical protein
MNNLPRLWRSELDSVLQAEASTRSPAERRKAFANLSATMRRNAKLVIALRAEGRHLLDARAAVLRSLEILAVRFPDPEAEEAFGSAIASALTWCLDLESRGKSRDTGKKTGVAIPRKDLNQEFCKHLAKKRKEPESIAAEALNWLYRISGEDSGKMEVKITTNERKKLTKAEQAIVEKVTRAGQRWWKAHYSK